MEYQLFYFTKTYDIAISIIAWPTCHEIVIEQIKADKSHMRLNTIYTRGLSREETIDHLMYLVEHDEHLLDVPF